MGSEDTSQNLQRWRPPEQREEGLACAVNCGFLLGDGGSDCLKRKMSQSGDGGTRAGLESGKKQLAQCARASKQEDTQRRPLSPSWRTPKGCCFMCPHFCSSKCPCPSLGDQR